MSGSTVDHENHGVGVEVKLEDGEQSNQYLSLEPTLEAQDGKKLLEDDGHENSHSEDKASLGSGHGSTETHEFDANQHPPDLFTGTFQEESSAAPQHEVSHADTDVYLSTSEQTFLQGSITDNIKDEKHKTDLPSDATGIAANISGMIAEDDDAKERLGENDALQMQRQAMSVSQETQSAEASPVVAHIQGIEGHSQIYSQQPTYVLLQTGGDQDGGGQPQVFLAMQTGGVSNTDSQAYITLHPVSVEGQDLSGAFSAEGLNLQNAVLTQSGIAGDVSMELSHHVSLGDLKGLQLGQAVDSNSQMFISSSGQLVTAADGTDPSGTGVITYIQPVNALAGGQTQVLMAVAEEDGHSVGDGGQMRAKMSAAVVDSNVDDDSPTQSQKISSNGTSQSRRRLSNDPRTCDECGRTFKYPSDLKKHLQIHTDMKKFQCEDCCRCFRRLHQLNVHKRIHSGEKPYVCNRCGAEFRHDSTLTMHIRTRHDHLKPFSCDGCGKNFGRMSHLRKHQRNVCGKGAPRGNLFVCKYCDESFSRKTDLRQHFLSCEKKPEKPDKDILAPTMFSCEHCGKEFIRNYDFKRHQLSHTDEKPFACSHCSKNFKERSSLYKHVKRMHSLLSGDSLLDSSQDDSIETDAAQRAIATITSAEDRMASSHSADIIVSLAHGINSASEADTIATFAHADHILQGSHTIAAADILNFPEVAAALGLSSASQTGGQTMVVEQHVDTGIISMDTDHVPMQGTGLSSVIEEDNEMEMAEEQGLKQFNPRSVSLHLSSDGLIINTTASSVDQQSSVLTHGQTEVDDTSKGEALDADTMVSQQNDVMRTAVSHSEVMATDIMEVDIGIVMDKESAEKSMIMAQSNEGARKDSTVDRGPIATHEEEACST